MMPHWRRCHSWPASWRPVLLEWGTVKAANCECSSAQISRCYCHFVLVSCLQWIEYNRFLFLPNRTSLAATTAVDNLHDGWQTTVAKLSSVADWARLYRRLMTTITSLVSCMLKIDFFSRKFKKLISQKVLKQSLPNFTPHWTEY